MSDADAVTGRATRATTAGAALLGLLLAWGCGGDAGSEGTGGARGAGESEGTGEAAGPTRVAVVERLRRPESALFDSARDVYLVSNIAGEPTEEDGNGFIARIDPTVGAPAAGAPTVGVPAPDAPAAADPAAADPAAEEGARGTDEAAATPTAPDRFIQGGRADVVLHAPKGMALTGDTLWVADIDAVRAFDAGSGEPLFAIELAGLGALFLNDIAAGPDGALYVTDSGLRAGPEGNVHTGPDRVYRVRPGEDPAVALEDSTLAGPNGIFWDAERERFLIASVRGDRMFEWRPGEPSATPIATGPGGFDGIARLPDGRILVSSLRDSTVFVLREPPGAPGSLTALIRGVPSPADIGVDARRGRVLIPTLGADRLEVWEVR